jgi:DNA primase
MHIREQRKIGEYCYVENELRLLALIESGVIEWHVWNARVEDVEHPDRVIFDVDPGEGISWNAVTAAARELPAPDAWTATNIRERLRRQRSDPWRGYWSSKQRLVG